MDAAYSEVTEGVFLASALTRGPWHPDHQHAGPPSALICRAIERAAANDGLTHLARLTVNLLRPTPIGECRVDVAADYVGRSTGHFSGRLTAQGKDIARFTALLQREEDLPIPEGTALHPPPHAPKPPDECPIVTIPIAGSGLGYGDLVENRVAAGQFFRGPCAAWFRMNHPLVKDETPSAYQRVAVAGRFGQRDQRVVGLQQISLHQLRSDDQSLPTSGGRVDLPRGAQLVRRQRLRTGRVGAL